MVTYPNGNRYEGEWRDNQRNGNGVLEFANGDKYDGEWKNDVQYWKGKGFSKSVGTMNYANGDTFVGEWDNNLMNGKGTQSNNCRHLHVQQWRGL